VSKYNNIEHRNSNIEQASILSSTNVLSATVCCNIESPSALLSDPAMFLTADDERLQHWPSALTRYDREREMAITDPYLIAFSPYSEVGFLSIFLVLSE